jgi:hypothetical protein
LRAEADGKVLRRELRRDIKEALAPAVEAAKTSILSMSTGGLPHDGDSLRRAVAAGISTQIRMGGRASGAYIRARKITLRGFRNAPKRLNSPKGWRHPTFVAEVWVTQMGKPNWFDQPLREHQGEYREAVLKAMDNMWARINRKAR